MASDNDVRLHVYRHFRDRGRPPTAAETAQALGAGVEDVEGAYRRLAEGKVIVLLPDSVDVWMANPFSALPTPFRVDAGERSWWGTCSWDALGIPAMLREDGTVFTSCPDCEEPLTVEVRGGSLRPAEAVAHFLVPAHRWWDDIGFT